MKERLEKKKSVQMAPLISILRINAEHPKTQTQKLSQNFFYNWFIM